MQGEAQAKGDARLHLRGDALRVDRNAAIHRTHHPVHADGEIVLGHLGHLGHVTAEGFMHRHTQGMAIGQRRLPVGLLHCQVQYTEVARMVLEQSAPVLHRILAGRRRQLIDQRLHDKRGVGVAHRTQPQHADPGLWRMQFDLVIGQPSDVGAVGHALDRGLVDPVLDHARFKRGPGHDRLPDHHVLPGQRQAVSAQPDTRMVQERRAVIAAADIILPRPHGFHRCTGGLGDVHRFADEIRRRIGPAPEAATEKLGMDHHLFGFEPGDFPGDHLVQGLELGAGPDFALVLADAHGAVKRLHRRVGQIRHTVFGVDGLGRFRQRSLGIARLTGVQAGGGGEFAEAFQQRLAIEPRVRPRVPLDFQRIAPQLRRPVMIGNHRNARRHLHHFVHAGNRQRLGAFKGFDAAAEGG
ncbi:hypothetical protein D3C78_866420 [compost metagenome]